jgi:hypothetical protein
MAENNPMVGGPNYAQWLALTISPQRPAGLAPAPPASGGEQISIRLRTDRRCLLDALSERSGWSRNQVIEALLDSGLCQFFAHADDAASDSLLEDAQMKSMKARGAR